MNAQRDLSRWLELSAEIASCVRCPELAATRTQVVVGQWPPGARLLLIGEAPGAEEDAAGQPFIGKAGRLLDTVLAEAGLDRADCAVLNVLRCRPPGNRRPQPAEVLACSGWLQAQVDLIAPQLTVALGLTAATVLLGRIKTLAGARQQVHVTVSGDVLATYHPSAAIRFGPQGAPMAALREDLATAAGLLR